MRTAIAIFVKTPSLSPIKTRLSATLGERKAQEFYRLSLEAITAVIKQTTIPAYWAIAEKDGLNNDFWQDLPKLYTQTGNLGKRQHYIYQKLLASYDRVFLIGSDTPQLSTETFEHAIDLLDTHDFVIGPSRDGGYYLFGGRITTEQKIWTSVPWSTDITRAKLEAALPTKVAHLKTLTDVDNAKDLSFVIKEMPNTINSKQHRLLAWLNRHQQ